MQILLVAAVAMAGPPDGNVDLNRVFKAGEKTTFEFNSKIQVDHRQVPIETFIPENNGFTYTFTTAVENMKPDGVADLRFKRPKIILKIGETFESGPKQEALTHDENILFTISRRNQVLSLKDETPKKKPKKGEGGDEPPPMMARTSLGVSQFDIGGWVGQLRQLSAFVNFFDLGPILPNRPVAVGDTWKETVGYAPTTITSGADKGKNISGRIDYVMTFKGKADVGGKAAWLIEGKINQDTDAAPYIADLIGVKLERAPFKQIKLKMDGVVNYYLDQVNLQVMKVGATSQGEVAVVIPEYDGPAYEERFKSRASLVRK